jgi:enoyl-CoA hydratase
MSGLVVVDNDAGVATLTLNRPEARNALSSALLAELRNALADVNRDESVAAIILTGADPAFCAGLDLRELSQEGRLLDAGDAARPVGSPWNPVDKPLIGAINGAAITGGLELALNCDFLVASERAVFADTHARVGVLPGWGLTVLLPQRVGFAMARRMSFTGDFINAENALRSGLVTEVVAHDQLLTTARAIAVTIAANNRPAIAELHRSYRLVEREAAGKGIEVERAISVAWRKAGRSAGLAERVPAVFSRGRSQLSQDDLE